MGNELSIVNQNEIGIMDLGSVLAKSGYFSDARDAAQAIVKVLAGRELGFGPIASMTGFNIIKGKISMSANLMGAAVKRSTRYDYRVRKQEPDVCVLEFFERVNGKSESLGISQFTIEDAHKAGTQNLDKFPRNMLFARAMSNGVKWFCPDVTGGPVYTPEELGEVVDGETGEVVKPDQGPQWTETPVEPTKPVTQSWPTDAIDWAVNEWGVKSFAITGALKQSRILTVNDSAETVKHWLAIRKVERDNGVEGPEATARADADLQATRESA